VEAARSRAGLKGPTVVLAIVLATALVTVRITPVADSDFHVEAWRAYQPLMRGEFGDFWRAVPGYAGFVILVGAPLALLGDWIGVGESGIFIATAVPGAAALALLGARLAAMSRAAGSPGWWLVLGLACAGPIGWWALHYGHPEDLLAAGAAVSAVWCAAAGRSGAAAALMVVAVLSKQWAVLAALPAAAVAPRGRWVILAGAVAAAGATTLTQVYGHPTGGGHVLSTGLKFHTRQLWFPLGTEQTIPQPGILPGERLAPEWLPNLMHPLIIAISIPLTALWVWRRRHGGVPIDDVFLLLALLFLLRCVLDPWNVPYYHLPLVLSLLIWEVHEGRAWPTASFLVTGAVVLNFFAWETWQGYVPYLLYMAWTIPLVALLFVRLYGRRTRGARPPAKHALTPIESPRHATGSQT
jgi:hypothetical protein